MPTLGDAHYQEIAWQALNRLLDWERTHGPAKLEHRVYRRPERYMDIDTDQQQYRYKDMRLLKRFRTERSELMAREWKMLAAELKGQKFVGKRTLLFEESRKKDYHRRGLMIDVHVLPGSFRSSSRIDKSISSSLARVRVELTNSFSLQGQAGIQCFGPILNEYSPDVYIRAFGKDLECYFLDYKAITILPPAHLVPGSAESVPVPPKGGYRYLHDRPDVYGPIILDTTDKQHQLLLATLFSDAVRPDRVRNVLIPLFYGSHIPVVSFRLKKDPESLRQQAITERWMHAAGAVII